MKKLVKPNYTDLTTYNIRQAAALCNFKKGAGRSKWTKVKLEFEFKTGTILASTLLQKLADIIDSYKDYVSPSFGTIHMNTFKIIKQQVVTELENNLDREW